MKNIGQVGILAVGKCQKEVFFFFFLIFIYLAVLSLSFTMQNLVSLPGIEPRFLNWQPGDPATGPPQKS